MIKKSSLAALAFTVISLAACGRGATTSETAGSGVNNGPGPVGDILQCQGAPQEKISFTIRHTAAVNFKQGLLVLGDKAVSMKCDKQAPQNLPGADRSVTLWKCTELRNGDGLFHVNVVTQGNSAIILAKVSLDQMFPLPPKELTTLGCRR